MTRLIRLIRTTIKLWEYCLLIFSVSFTLLVFIIMPFFCDVNLFLKNFRGILSSAELSRSVRMPYFIPAAQLCAEFFHENRLLVVSIKRPKAFWQMHIDTMRTRLQVFNRRERVFCRRGTDFKAFGKMPGTLCSDAFTIDDIDLAI